MTLYKDLVYLSVVRDDGTGPGFSSGTSQGSSLLVVYVLSDMAKVAHWQVTQPTCFDQFCLVLW